MFPSLEIGQSFFFFAPLLCPTDNFSKIHLEIPDLRPFKRRPDLSIKSRDVESFSIEILFYKERNTLINVLYRPPKGVIKPFERFLKEILKKTKKIETFPYCWWFQS